MSDGASREMTLFEIVGKVGPNHRASKELHELLATLAFYARGNHTYSHPDNAVSDYEWDSGMRAREVLKTIQKGESNG